MSLQVPYDLTRPFSVHKVTTNDQIIRVFKFPEEATSELSAISDYGFSRREIFAYELQVDRDAKYTELTA